jgi:hypothetical protein
MIARRVKRAICLPSVLNKGARQAGSLCRIFGIARRSANSAVEGAAVKGRRRAVPHLREGFQMTAPSETMPRAQGPEPSSESLQARNPREV